MTTFTIMFIIFAVIAFICAFISMCFSATTDMKSYRFFISMTLMSIVAMLISLCGILAEGFRQ